MPDVARVVLHGVGEPMLVKDLPRMVRYLKDRGIYVLFNTNGTLLNEKHAGADRCRAGRAAGVVRRGECEDAISRCGARIISTASCKNVRAFTELQECDGARNPRVSVWLTGLKETIEQLTGFCPPRRVDGRAGGVSAATGIL